MNNKFKSGDWIRTNPDLSLDRNFWIFQVYKVEQDCLWSIISFNVTKDLMNTDMGYICYSDYPKARLASPDEIKLVKQELDQRFNKLIAVNLLLLSNSIIHYEI